MAAINRALDELQRASQAMAEHLYGRAPRRVPAPAAGARLRARHRRARSAISRTAARSGHQARRRHRRRIRREKKVTDQLRLHGLSFRSTHAQEPGGGAASPGAGARARASAAGADAPAGRALASRPAGRPLALEPARRQPRPDPQGRRGRAQCPAQGVRRRDDDQSRAQPGLRSRCRPRPSG